MAIGYKLFRLREGKLFPLYVLATEEVPMGMWIDAKEGNRTEKGKVKSKLGELAYRPGWHICDGVPYVEHIYSRHNGQKFLKDGTVWCEVEYHTDKCYSIEARENGWRNGRWAAVRAQLDHIPVGGYYHYKTSPQMYGRWIISGEMRVNRILTDDEVEQMCREKGLVPLRRYGKEVA